MNERKKKERKVKGPTETWTRIAGFKVQSANHYTMGPWTMVGTCYVQVLWENSGKLPWLTERDNYKHQL